MVCTKIQLKKKNQTIREAQELASQKAEEEKQTNEAIIKSQKDISIYIDILMSSIEALELKLDELEKQQKLNENQINSKELEILEQQGTIDQLLSSSMEAQNRESNNRNQNPTDGVTTSNQLLSIIFCNECSQQVTGQFRYICIQCPPDQGLVDKCATTGCHPEHFIVRIKGELVNNFN